VHVMRQVDNRQLSDANFQLFLPTLLKYSAKCWLLHQRPRFSSIQNIKANLSSPFVRK
jgi:hypothetical protein